ncbi:MAG: 30S ribosomal protein S21 [Chloroherpetonaceae bacterium]|nr:30S ribosomal protein S21 [Chloroherpetonaceae bacterium]MCS7211455.1 30S ribosomal protein S21 [Chloroherpetonaceae bacterium]MDW8020030.1 30S ribosomal protein S21 [Chloroherpetonaceae bacterium]MDW8466342.1 30S ribosomal protein S21 [Chloroherpetonaceae bacterium]
MVGVQLMEGESIDKMLKRFKKKYERAGILKEYRRRTYYTKPSVEERLKESRRKRRAQRLNEELNS